MHLVLYFLAIFCLGQSANLVKWAGAPPDVIGFWRLLAASILLVPLALRKGKPQFSLSQIPTDLKYIALTALFFFAHLWTYVYSAQNTSVANCMIIFATNPLFIAGGSYLFFKDKMTLRLLTAYAIAFLGIIQLVSHSLQWNSQGFKGDLSALASALFFSGYLLTAKRSRMSFGNSTYSCLLYILTALFFGISGWSQGLDFLHYPLKTWVAIGGTVLLPTLLGHALFSYLMQFMNLNLMTCGKLIEPVISALTAYFIFAEAPGLHTYIAFILTAIGILILFFPWHRWPFRLNP